MSDQVTEEGVRPQVAALSKIPEDLSNVTMRFGVDLLKGFQAFDESSITPVELSYATQNFIEVANAIAVREGVPGSLIGYVIQETAVQELQLTMVADVEAQMNAPTEPDLIDPLDGIGTDLAAEEAIEVGGFSPEELTDEDTLIVDDLSGPLVELFDPLTEDAEASPDGEEG